MRRLAVSLRERRPVAHCAAHVASGVSGRRLPARPPVAFRVSPVRPGEPAIAGSIRAVVVDARTRRD
ncbi:hypothetical protein GN316_12790 [Xylophilus sp. Kf1]|nr:hypothetical protein [Xylophilus sp. Kf1]